LLLLLEAIWKENITGNEGSGEGSAFNRNNARVMRAGTQKESSSKSSDCFLSHSLIFFFTSFFIFVVLSFRRRCCIGLILLHYLADEMEELRE